MCIRDRAIDDKTTKTTTTDINEGWASDNVVGRFDPELIIITFSVTYVGGNIMYTNFKQI